MTVLGMHSVAELTDLVAAKDYVVRQVSRAYLAGEDAWKARAPGVQAAWRADFRTLLVKYNAARALAMSALAAEGVSLLPDSANAGPVLEGAYRAVLRSLRRTEGVDSPGDLQDLYARLVLAGFQVDLPHTPQPALGTDLDLEVYTRADAAQKAVVRAASTTAKAAPWLGAAAVLAAAVVLTRR